MIRRGTSFLCVYLIVEMNVFCYIREIQCTQISVGHDQKVTEENPAAQISVGHDQKVTEESPACPNQCGA